MIPVIAKTKVDDTGIRSWYTVPGMCKGSLRIIAHFERNDYVFVELVPNLDCAGSDNAIANDVIDFLMKPESESGKYSHRGFGYGTDRSFQKTFEATLKDGVVEIFIPFKPIKVVAQVV